MTGYRYLRLDVFTERPLAGNQLAVILDAEGLDAEVMQQIANEFSLPETTFVLPPTSANSDFRVRIFTPDRELPMAGHPTVGTAFALADAGKLVPGADKTVFELGIGPTRVLLEWESEHLSAAWMSQPAPEFGPCFETRSIIAEILGIGEVDVVKSMPAQVISSGVPFLFVPLVSRSAVDGAVLNRTKLIEACQSMGLPEMPVYIFTLEKGNDPATTYSRMFAPVLGIQEDPATGGASGPLGAWLVRYGAVESSEAKKMVNIQGVRMNRPGRIYMSVDQASESILVGGASVFLGEGWLHLPS